MLIELKNYDVEIYYEPEEKMTREYPGCDEVLEIVTIYNKICRDVTDELSDKEKEILLDEVRENK